MIVTVEQAALSSAMRQAVRIVQRHSTIPILSHVLVTATTGALEITATDLDARLTVTIEAETAVNGQRALPAGQLAAIAAAAAAGSQIRIEAGADDGRARLGAGRAKWAMATLPGEDFPAWGREDEAKAASFRIEAPRFLQLINHSAFAVSTEETRYYLNGSYLHVGETDGERRLLAVATDGHRLAIARTDLPDGAGEMPGVIVARQTMAALQGLIDATGNALEIRVSAAAIAVEQGDWRLVSKLIDGAFPDYQRVVPSGDEPIARLDAPALRAALGRVRPLAEASKTGSPVKIEIGASPAEGGDDRPVARISARGAGGEASDELAIDWAGGEPVEFGVNVRYLESFLARVGDGEVGLQVINPGSPVRLHVDGEMIGVVMPMRV
ncbi:DNA polymerase III subunit beta [Oceanibacterium hippocampi]|uniref:Beta sliding clamp n=1 Tax=Oceanibacterium hippocampi TaxID=745714 RepID=A0A1Y5U5Q6_9PROT|nr:DNA polymerase III subunit beta [Oceanibacterium hippocampi]SLN77522.1 DNA polymerase III subunit beta [Oceanibacterium hippocampi]